MFYLGFCVSFWISFLLATSSSQSISLKEDDLLIMAVDERTIQVEWKHLLLGNIESIEEVEIKQKIGPGQRWISHLKLKPNQTVILDKFSICKELTKLTLTITPKLGLECHPHCSSVLTDYKPDHFFNNITSPLSCFKDSTTLFIQLDDNMIKDGLGVFTNCVKNVKVYQNGQLSKFRGKVTLSENKTLEIKKNNSTNFYDLVYEMIDMNQEKTSTIAVKRLDPNLEQKCPPDTPQPFKKRQVAFILYGIIILVTIMVLIAGLLLLTKRKRIEKEWKKCKYGDQIEMKVNDENIEDVKILDQNINESHAIIVEKFDDSHFNIETVPKDVDNKRSEKKISKEHNLSEDSCINSNDQIPTTNIQIPTTNDQIHTTNDSIPTTNDQIPTTSYQIHTTNDSIPTTIDQIPTTNDQMPTTNDQTPTTNDQTPTTNDQIPTTNDQIPSTNDQLPTTNDQIPTKDDKKSTTNDQIPITNDKMSTTNHKISASNDQILTTNYQIPTSNDKISTSNEQIPTTNYQIPISNDQIPPTNNQMPPTNNYLLPFTNDQIPTTTDELSTTNNKFPTTNDQIPTTNDKIPTTNDQIPTTEDQHWPGDDLLQDDEDCAEVLDYF